ncbi:hypothetical protein [Sphingobacterium sp. WOUb80]|uniref:hypothetical protein n=1 Tax=Sphingobacterium sp. WOUb80 TaxID=3234028 RepID=UPI003CE6DB70
MAKTTIYKAPISGRPLPTSLLQTADILNITTISASSSNEWSQDQGCTSFLKVD